MTLMMLKHLREHGAVEPPMPARKDRYEHEEMTALHYEWSRSHQAIRLLVGHPAGEPSDRPDSGGRRY